MTRILIAGFGDTGVLVAAHLKGDHHITAITTKPMLVSGQELGSRLTRLEAWKRNYLLSFDQLPALKDVNIMQGQVTSIDPERKTASVKAADGTDKSLPYDVLVIASGTRNGFWRTDNIQNTDDIKTELSDQANRLAQSRTIAIIGAGPTGVSTASNLAEVYPDKRVHLFYRQDLPLAGYHDNTRKFVAARLAGQGVSLHPGHRAKLPKMRPYPVLRSGTIAFEGPQDPFKAGAILWAVGETRPNNSFIPKNLLNQDGFVRVNPFFQTPDHPEIFAIGDIAATDPFRCSARNMGYQLAARNIEKFTKGRPEKMKPFKPPSHRWGSVMGIQNEGLRLFTAKGGTIRLRPWTVRNIIYPFFVDRAIYRGIDRN